MAEKVWAVRVDGRMFQVQDLPVGVLASIAERSDATWLDVMMAPARDAGIALAILAAACEQLGADAPEGLTGRQLLERFELVNDDLPQEFTDGIPPKGADL